MFGLKILQKRSTPQAQLRGPILQVVGTNILLSFKAAKAPNNANFKA